MSDSLDGSRFRLAMPLANTLSTAQSREKLYRVLIPIVGILGGVGVWLSQPEPGDSTLKGKAVSAESAPAPTNVTPLPQDAVWSSDQV